MNMSKLSVDEMDSVIAEYIFHSALIRQETIAALITMRNEEFERRIVEFCHTGK